MQISDVTANDLGDVLALNEASVPHVNSLSADEMRWFLDHAPYFRLVRCNHRLAGFLVGLMQGLDYASINYRFFCRRYEVFGYVDRVAVASHSRQRGIASRLYDDFTATLRGHAPVLVCEVNIRPPNTASLAYHERHGFARIGTQETEGGKKEVVLLEKRL